MVYKFFDKKPASFNKSSGRGIANEPNYQRANELHKPIVGKFKACVRYFLSNFLFFSPNDSPLKTMKNVFI